MSLFTLDNYNELCNYLNVIMNETICVSVWRGYGPILQIGFGSEILPEPIMKTRPNRLPIFEWKDYPKYELQTEYSSWKIKLSNQHDIVSAEDDYSKLKCIIGLKILNWECVRGDAGIILYFENKIVFELKPYDTDSDDDISFMLWVSQNDGYKINCNGRIDRI